MEVPHTLIEKTGPLATITLNRPHKANALSVAMRASLEERLKDVAVDETIDVVLIQAEGQSFCGGLDLQDLPDNPSSWRERVLAAQMNHLAVVHSPKVVIAAVQGAVVGGGASLALSADILVMSTDAKFSFPFLRLGIIPDGGSSYFLQAKLGVPIALDLLLTAGTLGAEEAARLGLTRRVVPASELRTSAAALAQELARLPREARMLTKSLCRRFWAPGLEDYLAHEADAFAFSASTPGHRTAMQHVKRASSRKGAP